MTRPGEVRREGRRIPEPNDGGVSSEPETDRGTWSDPVVLWRHPTKASSHTPLVVLLHGRGADETDLADLAFRLPRHCDYASVRAPVPVDGGGYTWFENKGPARPVTASLRASVASFRRWIDGSSVGPARTTCYLFGFSAGMMMASALLLDDPKRFAGAVLLSGAMPLDAMASEAVDGRLAGVPIFHAHGTSDDMIPASLVQRTQNYLQHRSGANLTSQTYTHGHEISHREIDNIAAWFANLA